MKGIDFNILNAVLLADGALADANMTEIDMSAHSLSREFVLTGKIVPNTTAPGASKSLALNWYWSDYQITTPATNVPLLLSMRKFTTGPIALPNLTLAQNGERRTRFHPCEFLSVLTTTGSTTTATLTFPPGYNPKLNVGDMITVFGGTVGGDGDKMQGTYPIAAVTHTSGANGQLVTTATYTITSTTGTLVGNSVIVERSIRRGVNQDAHPNTLRPLARWLYVSVDRLALTSLATTTLTVDAIRMPSTSIIL